MQEILDNAYIVYSWKGIIVAAELVLHVLFFPLFSGPHHTQIKAPIEVLPVLRNKLKHLHEISVLTDKIHIIYFT